MVTGAGSTVGSISYTGTTLNPGDIVLIAPTATPSPILSCMMALKNPFARLILFAGISVYASVVMQVNSMDRHAP